MEDAESTGSADARRESERLNPQLFAGITAWAATAWQTERLPDYVATASRYAFGGRGAPDELARHFTQALLPRTKNRHGSVTLHSYHF